jgi:hypothetical protein
VGRKAAAIGRRHKQAGYEAPANLEGVKSVLRGIRRTLGVDPSTRYRRHPGQDAGELPATLIGTAHW